MFIIAEISPQFGSDLALAERMILQSKLAGASAVKVQLFSGEFVRLPDGTDRSYLALSRAGFERLFAYAERIGIDLFATAFDSERLEWCRAVGQSYYKVAARSHAEDPELVQRVLAEGRTTFVSVPSGVDPSTVAVNDSTVLLYCIPKYPTLLEEADLPDFASTPFAGISDHSPGIAAALMACARGATHVEKHFTISPAWQRHTEKAHFGAMTPEDLTLLSRLSSEMERTEAWRSLRSSEAAARP